MTATPTDTRLTADQAALLILAGARFGAVFPRLATEDDAAALRAWYTFTPGVPVGVTPPARPARQTTATGDLCGKCGGLMVRTGTCMTCQGCGDSSGGCG